MEHIDLRTLKHDLRTPVNHIVGYSELIMEMAMDAGHHDAVRHAGAIRAEGQKAAALIDHHLGRYCGDRPQEQVTALRTALSPVVGRIENLAGELAPFPQWAYYADDADKIRTASSQLARTAGAKRPDDKGTAPSKARKTGKSKATAARK
jgi:signal transduction histidine kinase